MPGAASVVTEAGVLMSMRQGEVIEDPEEHMMIGFTRDEVIVDVREFLRRPEVLGQCNVYHRHCPT